ncbi:MAG: elongation factor EF-2 [Nitrosopumilaceae archaeon]|nr:elongation factor EF-2 [Nitrosopumilaceae archaeon]NIU02465.1 elongation factor EF-2 [Nitrosopumilaceae archaeon]NIU88926.1 elongation factor EF-2 [Nitrosopumilaceae archaeon]NIV67037.1 elongation factor EF-2 [Nitrosopumilaceae archaeon]NIX63066.1 elongation factor EF-2 [Nitrosopumilaceae archaeon]
MKYKSTDHVMKIIKHRDQIRNFGVIAHVDHGKTTMSDSLLAHSGIIAPSAAGKALALDFNKEEQERGITIYQANATLYYKQADKEFVINMVDTPGHVDFSGRVIRSLRSIDGAVVVCDAVEGIMTQTETVTRMALEERVRPVLFINKIDRLIKELRLTPEKMQETLATVVSNFNQLIDTYAEPEYREKWKVSIQDGSVTFGSAKDRWAINIDVMKASGVSFKDVITSYTEEKVDALVEKAPLGDAVLGMVVKHHPPPHVAQKYRIPKIWKGDLDSDVGKAILNCDENGPAVMMIVNMALDPAAGPVAIGRLFSGTLKDGMPINIIDANREGRIQSVNFFMGNQREQVGEIPCGNIPALLGLVEARAGNTLSTVKGTQRFEAIKYVSEPVVQVAIEPKHPKDLPRLVEVLKRLTIEDPNLIIKIDQESGETIMAGMGVLHLDIATHAIQEAKVDIVSSPPLINYRETIKGSCEPIMSKSPNRHNKIFMKVEPLEPEIADMIRTGEIGDLKEKKEIARILREKGWDADVAKNVMKFDPRGNVMINGTKGVQFIQESTDSILSGWEDVMKEGPLAKEQMRNCKFTFHHFVPHEDPAHRGLSQLGPASRRACMGSTLLATPTLLEPVLAIEIRVPQDQIGNVSQVLSGKRGKVLDMQQKGPINIVNGELPASETFDLSEIMRGQTAGKAMWNTHFKAWAEVPKSIQTEVIGNIRKRKGLAPDIPSPNEFIDKE